MKLIEDRLNEEIEEYKSMNDAYNELKNRLESLSIEMVRKQGKIEGYQEIVKANSIEEVHEEK